MCLLLLCWRVLFELVACLFIVDFCFAGICFGVCLIGYCVRLSWVLFYAIVCAVVILFSLIVWVLVFFGLFGLLAVCTACVWLFLVWSILDLLWLLIVLLFVCVLLMII